MESFLNSVTVQAVVLGIIQGLTEFLPVSSSGHLALAEKLLPGFNQPGMLLEVMLHLGTLAAVVIYYRRDLYDLACLAGSYVKGGDHDPESKKLLLGVIAASIPTAVIGLLLEERVEVLADSALMVGIALMVTGAVLIVGEKVAARVTARPGNPGLGVSLLVGVAQGIAVIPGISRSGATISMARARGVGGPEAARFGFLISLPAVGGAALLKAVKHREEIMAFSAEQAGAYLAGAVVAGVVGYLAISVVMGAVKRGKLAWFSPYCFLLGAAAVIIDLTA
jgi:undecaprenyl-diphosphatase